MASVGSFNLPHQTGYVITSCISSSVRHAIVPPLFQRFRVTSKNNSNTLPVVRIFSKKEKKLRFQKHPDASVQGLTRKHVGLFAKHATINALSPLTLTFLRTLVSSNEETLPQFEDFFHSCFPYPRCHYLVYLFAGLCKGDFNPSKSSKATTIQCY